MDVIEDLFTLTVAEYFMRYWYLYMIGHMLARILINSTKLFKKGEQKEVIK